VWSHPRSSIRFQYFGIFSQIQTDSHNYLTKTSRTAVQLYSTTLTLLSLALYPHAVDYHHAHQADADDAVHVKKGEIDLGQVVALHQGMFVN